MGQNPDPLGINEELTDQLVALTREAKMYLVLPWVITVRINLQFTVWKNVGVLESFMELNIKMRLMLLRGT